MSRPRTAVPVLATTVIAVLLSLLGTPASAAPATGRYERQVVREVNDHRDAAKLGRVRASRCADRFAERWARRIHRGGKAPALRTVRRRCGGAARAVGLVRRRHTPARVVRSLSRTRRGHRALGHRRMRQVGVGAVVDRRGRWTVVVVLTGPKARHRSGNASEATAVPEEVRRYVTAIHRATNAARLDHGLEPFKVSACAERFAQGHSQQMATTGAFEHADLGNLLARCDAHAAGENIAYTYRSEADHVVGMWMDSPGHRANILSSTFTHLGIGVARDAGSGRWYATQDFTDGPH